MLISLIPGLFAIGFLSQPAAVVGTLGLAALAQGMFGATLP